MSCKITYKGKQYTEQELMEVLAQDKSFVDKYRPQEQRVIGSEEREDMATFEAKVNALQENMDVEVILDENIETSRVLPATDERVKKAGKPVILINPNAIFTTTAIHEFGHIFIDALPGGTSNKRFREAVAELEGTELYDQVKALYPDLSQEMFEKELVTTAIGNKGSEIWADQEKAGRWEAFKTWFFDFIKRTLGLNQSQVESLAKDMLSGRVQADLTSQLSNAVQEQRLAEVLGEDPQLNQAETKAEVAYNEMLARVENLYELYKPKSRAERTNQFEKEKAGERTPYDSVSEMKDALMELRDADQVLGFSKFVKWAGKETGKLRKRIDRLEAEGGMTVDDIVKINEFSAAFDILEDIRELIISAKNSGDMPTKRADVFLKGISKITSERDNQADEILAVSKEHFARTMAKHDDQWKEKRKQDFAKLWEETQPEVPKEQFIQEMFNKYKDEIFEESLAKYRERAEKSIGDISSGVGMLATEKNMKSDEIQVASALADGKEYAVGKFASEEASLFDKWVKDYRDEVSNAASQEKKYEKMMETTSDGQIFYAGEYSAEFYVEQKKMRDDSNNPDVYMDKYAENKVYKSGSYSLEGGKNKKKIIIKGGKITNVTKKHITYKIGKEEYTIPTEEAIAKSEFHYWNVKNTRKVKTEEGWRTEPSIGKGNTRDWRNKQYASLSDNERKHLDFLKGKIKEADALTSGTESLIKYTANQEFMLLPSVTKSSMDRIYSGQGKGLITDMVGDWYKVREDDFETSTGGEIADSVKAFADVSNREKFRVPIPFRHNIPNERQSRDLHTITLMNLVQAKNYEQKKSVESLLLVMADVMNNRLVPQTQGLQRLKKIHASSTKDEVKQLFHPKDYVPNDYKKMMSLIENRIYNIKNKSAGEVAGMDVQKLTSSWLKYSGMTSLVFNIPASIVNLQVGKLNNLIEAIGGDQFGFRDLQYAKAQYWKDMRHILNDVGTNVDASRTNLFMNILNVMGSKNYLDNNFEEGTRLTALMKINQLRPIAKMGEHMMQAEVMYATMRSIRVTNENGQYLNKEGKVVKSKKEAASINEVITFDTAKDGAVEMKLPDWAKGNTFSGNADHNTQIIELRNLVKKKIMDLHGNYDSDIQSAAQREFWGKLLFFLRKWIEPGYYRRWRGLPSIMKKHEDLTEADQFFSKDLKQFQEGYYVTATRFLGTMVRGMKKMEVEVVKTGYNNLSPMEKANLRKMMTEVGIIVMSYLAYLGLGGDDSDDENLWARYQLRRQVSEMSFFLVPSEAYKIVSTPTASMGMAKRMMQIFGQGTRDFYNLEFERYDQGKNKDRSKLGVYTLKALPFAAQTEKDLKESLKFLNNMN